MAVELVRSNRLFSGVPYAYAATAPEIGLIVTAGACPLDDQGRVVAPGDIAAQMRQALDNLRIALEESGAAMRDVLKTTIFVSTSSRDDLVVAWNAVAGGFGDHNPPAHCLASRFSVFRISLSRSKRLPWPHRADDWGPLIHQMKTTGFTGNAAYSVVFASRLG
jgi:enamine deaminase RidA (YjgF/YER057c/UK114 family)